MNFFSSFQESVLEIAGPEEVGITTPSRVRFLLTQFEMVPSRLENLFGNLLYSYPTSPIYAYLGLGATGTNISRFTSIKRIVAHGGQPERCGCFYNFIAPSRVGKGVAMSILSEIGNHVQVERMRYYRDIVLNSPHVDANRNPISRSAHVALCSIGYPRSFFLSGANGLQTQAVAAGNAGCGLIFEAEMKSGRSRYTDLDSSSGPLLSFYDMYIPEKSHRKADKIACI